MPYSFSFGKFRDEKGRFVKPSKGRLSSIARAQEAAWLVQGTPKKTRRRKSKPLPKGYTSKPVGQPSKKFSKQKIKSKKGTTADFFKSFVSDNSGLELDESVRYGKFSLRADFNSLKRKYKKVDAGKFMYNNGADLTKKGKKIVAYYLVKDEATGTSVFQIFYRRSKKSVSDWRKFLEDESEEIFIDKVLKQLNISKNRNYKMLSFIGWGWPRPTDKDKFHGRFYKK